MEAWAVQRKGHSGPARATCAPPAYARAAPRGQAMIELPSITTPKRGAGCDGRRTRAGRRKTPTPNQLPTAQLSPGLNAGVFLWQTDTRCYRISRSSIDRLPATFSRASNRVWQILAGDTVGTAGGQGSFVDVVVWPDNRRPKGDSEW